MKCLFVNGEVNLLEWVHRLCYWRDILEMAEVSGDSRRIENAKNMIILLYGLAKRKEHNRL